MRDFNRPDCWDDKRLQFVGELLRDGRTDVLEVLSEKFATQRTRHAARLAAASLKVPA